ncbi:LemA family protein [Clostridiales bacterium BAD-6]|uniref:LemA family protein n=2 Tax=Sinanaerobacter chloroacetimidivorans TaxID=2818044 RepID=A0A8J8B3D1_9FIRM|nr:LemA family protein [Sinanaerobacter chloroacetimidivorans]
MMYIILGIIMVIFAWMQLAYGRLQKHKNDARTQWTRIDALLQSRSQFILRLMELAESHDFEDRELLAEMYDLQGGYIDSTDRELISESAETVTPLLDRFLHQTKEHPALWENEEFMELVQELSEMEEEIQLQSSKYNQFIDLYNEHRQKPSLKYQIAILGAMPLRGIHLKSDELPLIDQPVESPEPH